MLFKFVLIMKHEFIFFFYSDVIYHFLYPLDHNTIYVAR